MVKLPLRNKSVGTKVTEAEFVALEIQARARKLTLSEWVRAELLEPKQSRDDDVLLAEVLALRTIMINLLFSLAKGERLTTEAMKELIERADGDKVSRAMERLSAGRKVVSKSVAELEVEARA